MKRESVKQRLLVKLAERIQDERDPGIRSYYRMRFRELSARGSGALPWWAKDLAYRWRIE